MRILITAGPTREYFDTVRFISNPSSGKMGYEVAAVAARRGHDVVLVSGPVERPDPDGVNVLRVVSAAEMFEASIVAFETCAAAILTAAVCDYRPTRKIDHKLKKQARMRPIQLQPTKDICAYLGRIKVRRVVIGFAMEDHDHKAHAEAKLKRKQCDAIVLNGPENVGGDRAVVQILQALGGWMQPVAGSKREVAEHVITLVETLSLHGN